MKVYLFDVDGTLTPHRQPMTKEFADFFINFCTDNIVYLCTGSGWDKVQEQVPSKVISLCNGVFACSGNEYWSRTSGVDELHLLPDYSSGYEPSEELISDLELFLQSSSYPVKTGQHIEKRTGMINFSTVGRACTLEERKQYAAWDKENGERERIASTLRTKYPDLCFNIGGQISMDISPLGNDKSRSIALLRKWHPECSIHFFGDRLQPGGNDYPVLKELTEKDSYDQVETYEDTWRILSNDEPKSETDAETLKPKPSIKLAPRGIDTFTVCRQSDESGISGTGVVIEGVEYATGQVVLHWLTPFPKGSIAIFESIEDFKRVHVNPHPTNKTIITWSDGRQDEF